MKTCETLSDLHCRQFWSEDNQGNLNIGDEKILLGKSTRSEVDASDLVDHQAFISSYEKLPSDAKVALASLVEELKQHLGKESFKNSWKRKLAIIDYQIRSTIKDVAENRTFQRRPDLQLKGKRKEDKKFIDHHELAKDLFELKSELLRAKYEKHPNWLRVQRIFKRAQKDVIQVIEELNLDLKTKKAMQRKVKSVKLTLPFEDPRIYGSKERCGTDIKNAYYRLSKNKLTVCAGYFNAFQAEGPLYTTIAHEISHSIDPSTWIYDQLQKKPLVTALREVDDQGGMVHCKKWQSMKKTIFQEPLSFYKLPKKIEALTQCLVDRSDLKPLTLQSLRKPSESHSTKRIGSFAKYYSFTNLSQKKIFKWEQLVDNEFFQDPTKLSASYDNYLFLPNESGYFDVNAVFWQEYRCQSLKSKKEKKVVFESSIREIRRLHAIYNRWQSSHYGREDFQLVNFNLARPSYENWADWLAQKAFVKYLKRLKKERRRNLILAANSKGCVKAGLNAVAPQLVKIEKKYSNEVHPERRTRRLMLFDKYIAEQMGCRQGPEILSRRQQCEIK